MKRTKYDAPAPIVKPITIDVQKIWESKITVSDDLAGRVFENLHKGGEEECELN